ncbi:hypothetical protein P154DRAFT_621083 [Amniculicola lignicola CBS 123094]|uniref:FAD/NAD(P)-binding domain-containing protein n=1 Tax=Amniculicola lignicola CBS 123094 TaxID=1392246 RepID=A0A6A5WEJ5_9PLEO|nr:hypothetical protein P154DRAFT_621083 [Amniculicola lignicola CBS 123094]
MASTYEVVILGGNFAGLNIIHYLQRQVVPLLKKIPNSPVYHITLVSPNTHFFFKVAAPRALTKPGAIPSDKIFRPISEFFDQYGKSCTHLLGKAVAISPATHLVSISTPGGERKEVQYDALFICTGTTSASSLWTLHDDHEVSAGALKNTQELLPQARTVLIAGAGPVGVETAGEIASAYPQIKVTVVGEVLPKRKPATGAKAKKLLEVLGVEVLIDTKVKEATPFGASTAVELSTGTQKTVDMFIDARGPSKINSEFLPKTWLDGTGRVITRDAYFRVKGDGGPDVAGIYVLGDIVAGSTNTAWEINSQVPVAGSSFGVDVAAKLGHNIADSGGLLSWIPGMGAKGLEQKKFSMTDAGVVPIGPTGGVGELMGWQMPNMMVKKGKSERFLVELVDPLVTGDKNGRCPDDESGTLPK